MEKLEKNVLDFYKEPATRQTETKELVSGFALYYAGQKLGNDPSVQRNTLREFFKEATKQSPSDARKLVGSLALLALFRRKYWDEDSIATLFGNQTQDNAYDSLKLCLRFILDTKSSLVIPILARYQIEFGEMDKEKHFLRAVQAVTAFLVLRRAMTGGTAAIDSDFRSVMSPNTGKDGFPLCIGKGVSNRILEISDLKKILRNLLNSKKFGVKEKNTWLENARETPLGNRTSRAICRFLLFAANHNSMPDVKCPGPT